MQYNISYGANLNAEKVVTLELAKLNSKIIWDEEDALLNLILDSSINDAENYIDGPIYRKNVSIGITNWVDKFVFPIHPVSSVTSITYKDINGVLRTLTNAQFTFYFIEKQCKIQFKIEDTIALNTDLDFPITINAVAGYVDAEIPASIKNAVLLRFSHRHMFREDVPTSLDRTFYSSLRPYRNY
jgi:uncharacterized phiE125 gp8 family phage protein